MALPDIRVCSRSREGFDLAHEGFQGGNVRQTDFDRIVDLHIWISKVGRLQVFISTLLPNLFLFINLNIKNFLHLLSPNNRF